jgi:Ribonuclease G/E
MIRIHCAESPGEQRVALLRGDVLSEYYLHRPGAPDGFGALYWARVIARVPAMAGAFVALPEAEAFLPDTEGGAGLGAGDHVAVRVIRSAQGGKGPRVSAQLAAADSALGTQGPVRRLRPGPSPLEELLAAFPDARTVRDEFPEALASEIEALGEPALLLPGGMTGTVSATPALTAIDLDGGSASAVRTTKDRAQFAANLAALPALARQIALRNLAGAILVDFAGVPAKRRAALGGPLEAALAADRAGPRLVGFSGLGFAEILRPRRRPPLHEMLRGPHAAGLAALRQVAAEASASPGRRLALRASPGVVAALQADPVALPALARDATHDLVLRSEPGLGAVNWVIEDVRD